MKAPLPLCKDRNQKTFLVMNQIEPVYSAPEFISANNFNGLAQGVITQEGVLGLAEAAQSVAAGLLDEALATWHEDSVLAVKVGRVKFAANNPAWRKLTANGGGRDRIISEGHKIAEAWRKSDPLWVPQAGRTLTAFELRGTAAVAKFNAHSAAETGADTERGMLWDKVDFMWDLCVQWYEMATAAFAADTPTGYLIRTIPTTYNPNEAPGQLQFTQVFSPAPNQLKLEWQAPRGHHFNIFAKMPGALEFTQILLNGTQTSWMGEGMTAGEWMFKGEAKNSAAWAR